MPQRFIVTESGAASALQLTTSNGVALWTLPALASLSTMEEGKGWSEAIALVRAKSLPRSGSARQLKRQRTGEILNSAQKPARKSLRSRSAFAELDAEVDTSTLLASARTSKL